MRYGSVLLLTACLFVGGLTSQSAPSESKNKATPNGEMAEATITAWQMKGAEFGWMGTNAYGRPHWHATREPGDVPAFRMAAFDSAVLKELPQPAVPFGLVFHQTKINDGSLDVLRRFANLQLLDLEGTQVTIKALQALSTLDGVHALSLRGVSLKELGTDLIEALAIFVKSHSLDLSNSAASNEDVKALAELKQLQSLNLSNTQVTDEGVNALAKLQQLHTLYLDGTKVTDQVKGTLKNRMELREKTKPPLALLRKFRSLSFLRVLRAVDLSNTALSDQALVPIVSIIDLQNANLSNTHLTDEGLAVLGHLQQLQGLDLSGTEVTDSGLRNLGNPQRLEALNLHGTAIGNASLETLSDWGTLQILDLGETDVTDSGLLALAQLQNLRTLNLRGTSVTDKGVQELQRRIRNLEVTWK